METKYKLEDLKNIVCSTTTAIRFQCSYCHFNYARKTNLENHVKQKHDSPKITNACRSPSKRRIQLPSKFRNQEVLKENIHIYFTHGILTLHHMFLFQTIDRKN